MDRKTPYSIAVKDGLTASHAGGAIARLADPMTRSNVDASVDRQWLDPDGIGTAVGRKDARMPSC